MTARSWPADRLPTAWCPMTRATAFLLGLLLASQCGAVEPARPYRSCEIVNGQIFACDGIPYTGRAVVQP